MPRGAAVAVLSAHERQIRLAMMRMQKRALYAAVSVEDRLFLLCERRRTYAAPSDHDIDVLALYASCWSTLNAHELAEAEQLLLAEYQPWWNALSAVERKRFTLLRKQLRTNPAIVDGDPLALVKPFRLGDRDPCSHCGALLWKFERPKNGKRWICCDDGQMVVRKEDCPDLPAELEELYRCPVFVKHCRRINSLLSFTCIGTTPTRSANGRGLYSMQYPSVLRMEGKTYHLMVPSQVQGPLHFYFVSDPQSDPRLQAGQMPEAERQRMCHIVEVLRNWIKAKHVLGPALKQLGDVSGVTVHIEILSLDVDLWMYVCV